MDEECARMLQRMNVMPKDKEIINLLKIIEPTIITINKKPKKVTWKDIIDFATSDIPGKCPLT